MRLHFTKKAEKGYIRLPVLVQKKCDKQFLLLLSDYKHPSLRARKMSGTDVFEGRVDYHHRFTFSVEAGDVNILSIGPHDEGLGKK